ATDDPDAIHALYPSRKAVVSMVRRADARRAREILSKESGLRSVTGPIAVSGLVPIVPQQSFWPRISGTVPSRPRLYLAPLKVGTQFFCKPRLLAVIRIALGRLLIFWRVHPACSGYRRIVSNWRRWPIAEEGV